MIILPLVCPRPGVGDQGYGDPGADQQVAPLLPPSVIVAWKQKLEQLLGSNVKCYNS